MGEKARDKLKKFEKINDLLTTIGHHHTGAYAAQAAYFFVLSLIPIILLLLTMVQYTPATKADVMKAVVQIFPSSVDGLLVSIVNEVYNQSRTIIPITIVMALWSAGKGVLSVTYGLNLVYDSFETRGYLYLRIRATLYTFLFILTIVFMLTLPIFGDGLAILILSHAPLLERLIYTILEMRTVASFILLILFWIIVYRYLPNRKDKIRNQIPGAFFTALGWIILSFVFSVYLDIFTGFSSMYGSLTTIVLIMLWLYLCMYIMLLGAEVNTLVQRISDGENGQSGEKNEKILTDEKNEDKIEKHI